MKWTAYTKDAASVIVVVLVGVAYYMLGEVIDRSIVPQLFDQGVYVFAADDPSTAMRRWNLFSYIASIAVSGLVCAIMLILVSRFGSWLETLPAVATAAAFFGISLSREYYRLYPLSYDLIELSALMVALPLWFILIAGLTRGFGIKHDA